MHGTKTAISVLVQQTAPKEKEVHPLERSEPLGDKVKRYLRDVYSPDSDSLKQWKYLKCLYEKLSNMPKEVLTPEHKQILYWLEEAMEKYGNKDPNDSVEMDGEDMFKGHDYYYGE